jgi:ABC-type oligopeptide transport system substrate-binding subunit
MAMNAIRFTAGVLGVALLVTTASAQSTPSTQSPKPASPPNVTPFQQRNPALNTKLPNTVHEGGHKYLGRDPDAVVRSQIMRDEAMHKGNW